MVDLKNGDGFSTAEKGDWGRATEGKSQKLAGRPNFFRKINMAATWMRG